MFLIYEAPDSPIERYDLDELSSVESEEIERVTGLDWDEVETELKAQKPGALRAALWAFRKRSEPELRYSAFDVPGWRRRLRARLNGEEIADHVEEITRQLPDETSAERTHLLRVLRRVADDPADVQTAIDAGPKGDTAGADSAASPPSESATAGTSPTS